MNIVLIGYRGTGKSAVARLLAEQTGWQAVSTDAEIERLAGCTIGDLVAARGWGAMRDFETEVIREVAKLERTILDTGGGAVLREENREALRRCGSLFWLTARPETIVARIANEQHRPSLTGSKSFIEEVEEVLAERIPIYQSACHHAVVTDDRSIEAIVSEILDYARAEGLV